MFIRNGGLRRQQALFILGIVWILGASGCSKPAPTATADAAAPTAAQTTALDTSTVLAKTQYGTITQQDVTQYGMTGLCEPLKALAASTQTTPLTRDQYAPVIQWIASRQAAEAEAELKAKSDPKLSELWDGGLKARLNGLVKYHIGKTEIKDRATTPTQTEIQEYYKKNEPLYFQPFSVTMRMMLLQTYEPYIVQATDTLETIAQQISGDVKQADNIRADAPSRPLRREHGKLENPLYPGEKLLVPMSKERMDEVRARLEAIVKEMRGLKDPHELDLRFVALAKKYDESGLAGEITTPLPTGTRQTKPPLPEIMDAVRQTTVGQVSPVFQTKHGFQVIKLMDRVASHSLPLDTPAVRNDIIQTMMESRTKRAVSDLMATLMENPKLKVDYQLIARGNSLSTDTVVAVLGEEKLLWQDLKGTWESEHQPSEETRIRKAIVFNEPFAMMLFRDHLRAQMADPKTELGRLAQIMKTAQIGSTYLAKLATEEVAKGLTKERAQAYYKEHIANFTEPAKLAFEAAMWPIPNPKLTGEARKTAAGEVLKQLQEALKGVKTEQDFMTLKAELDEKLKAQNIPPVSMPEPLPVGALSPQMQKMVHGVPQGQWTPPVILGDSVACSLLVRERVAEKVLSFDEAINKVNKEIFLGEYDGIVKRLEQEYAKQAGLKSTPK